MSRSEDIMMQQYRGFLCSVLRALSGLLLRS